MIVPYQFDRLRDLVDEAAVGLGPAAPLVTVHMVQVAEPIPFDRRFDTVLCRTQERIPVDGQHTMAHAEFVVIAESIVVPDMDAVVHEVLDIGIARQEPQQFVDHAFQEYFFGRQQREAFAKVETHLVSEDAFGAGAGTVAADDALGFDPPQQVEVLFHLSSIFKVIPPDASSTAHEGYFSQHPRFITCRPCSR